MEREDVIEKFSEFLDEFYADELAVAVSEDRKSIEIDFTLLDKFDVELADHILENPEEAIDAAEEAIKQIDTGLGAKLRVRFFNLPESKQMRIRNVRAEHIGKLLSVDGIVKRASEIRPEIAEGVFQCPDCGARISVIQTERSVRSPVKCECGCRKGFRLIDRKLYDARWVTIEEPFEITTGERPSELTVFLKEDLTSPIMQNCTDPGNRIKVTGILKEIPRMAKGSRSRQMEIYMDANSVESVEVGWEELEITPEDEKKIIELAKDPLIYDKLVASLAPTIYGLEEIKEAIILQMFSGEPHILKDGTRIRGNIHILLVGDPSCLVADERVVMTDGTVMKIGKMGSRHLQKIDYRVHLGMGRKIGKANRFHIYKKQPIIGIVTETGKSIKGTYNQPILTVKNGQQLWKRLDEVKIGDRVQVLSKIECKKKSLVETNWTDHPYYHKSWHIKIPNFVDEELAGLFGYIIADGWVRKRRVGFIINKNEIDILPKIRNAFKKCFDAPVSTYKHKLASPKIIYCQVDRTHVARLLSFLNEKRVPDSVWNSRNSVVASFLRWLYEGDGSVFSKGRGRLSVSLKSTNIELLRDVQILLLRFGIHSRILWENKGRRVKIKGREIVSSPSGSLMIRRSESIIKFWKDIGFASEKKRSKLEQAVQYAKSHIRRIHKSRSEKIVEINRLPTQDVFDIEVPNYHRFVANGIIVHNTAKSQMMKLASTFIPRGKYASGTAVTGAGLCVTYDTIVTMDDGSLIAIGDLVERELSGAHKEMEPGVFVAKDPSLRKIMAFDPKDLKIKPLKITQYWKIRAPDKLVKIKTRTGKEIITTLDNPIPTIANDIVWKRASELTSGDFIATPRRLDINPSSQTISALEFMDKNAHLINSASIVNKMIKKIKEIGIRHCSKKSGIGEDSLYYRWRKNTRYGNPTIGILEKMSNDFEFDLENALPPRLVLSQYHGHTITIPSKLNEEFMYLVGLLAGDGSLCKTSHGGCEMKFHNTSPELLDSFSNLCKKQLSIEVGEDERLGVPYLRFRSKIFGNILGKFGVPNGDKSHGISVSEDLSKLPDNLLVAYLRGLFDTDGSVTEKRDGSGNIEISSASEKFMRTLQILLLRFGILSSVRERKAKKSTIRGRAVRSRKKWVLEIWGLRNLSTFENSIGFEFSKKSEKLRRVIERITKVDTNVDVVPNIGFLLRRARRKIGLSAEKLYGYQSYSYERGGRRPSREMLAKLVKRFKKHGKCEEMDLLENLAKSDIFWDEVKEVKLIENKGHDYVYDVTVEDGHSFVANGLVVHNTATVVRDEQFLGGWILEAGALVLANKSLCAIDEFSKVSPQDLIKLQEAMSLETISIAKASIVATLPAQTAILAGANPKLGRFDPYYPIREQVDIGDVLLSRFDLRFALRDVPNPDVDTKMAEHILKMRHFEPMEAIPTIEPQLLRKYIAYARANCHPELTKEAGEMLKSFYLDMRARGEEAPVSITLRQYEALIRLAEAAAKIRLSDRVDVEDAQRAINLMKASLRQFGFEPETGKIDIDRAEGYVPAAQRGKIRTMLDLIEALSDEFEREIPRDELLKRAGEQGIENAEDILNKMLREGILFSPRPGVIQKV